MDRTFYLNLNCEYRDTRRAALSKLEEIKRYLSLTDPQSDLFELKLPAGVDIAAAKKLVSTYLHDYDTKKRNVFIRGNNGKYLSGENGECGMRCNRSFPLGWEKFIIEDVGNGKIALKSMNKYVSSENGNGDMTCNRRTADAWEFFEMIDNKDDTVAFKGNNQKYVSSENGRKPITCYVHANQEWEKFHLHDISSFAYESEICYTLLNKYLIALCDTCDAAETERSKINPENYYYLKTVELEHHGRGNTYVSTHEERLFDGNGYKVVVTDADKKIVAAQEALDKHVQFFNWILIDENKKLQEITKVYNQFEAAIPQFQSILDQKKSIVASKVTDENDYGLVF